MGDKKIQNMLDRYKLTTIVGEDTLIWIKSVYITNWGGVEKITIIWKIARRCEEHI